MAAQSAIEYTRENWKLQSRATKCNRNIVYRWMCALLVPLHLIFWVNCSDPSPFGVAFFCLVAFMQSASIYAKHTLVVHSSPLLAKVMQTSRWCLCIPPKQTISCTKLAYWRNTLQQMFMIWCTFFIYINIFDMTHLFRLQSFEMDETGSGHSSFCRFSLARFQFCFWFFVVSLYISNWF